jgi:FkbM family methyltransferase
MKVHSDWLGENIFLGSYEKKELLMLANISNPRWVALDIGANIGYYSLFLEKSLHCSRILAFEPSPREYKLLQENLTGNRCDKVTTFNLALGDVESTIKLYLSSDNIGKNSINYFDTSDQEVTVPMKVLDVFLNDQNLDSIDFIKIDVEGAEPMVLKGAAATIQKFKPVILYESWAFSQAPYGSFECATTSILETYGYRIFDIDERGRLLQVNKGDRIHSDNALAIHHERLAEFKGFIKNKG